jgi:hypothetical protein
MKTQRHGGWAIQKLSGMDCICCKQPAAAEINQQEKDTKKQDRNNKNEDNNNKTRHHQHQL